MADRWTLKTPAGDVELNETFHAVTLTPGGVDGGGLLRRGRDRAYQRSGDGMRTPGPLRLRGLVWDDSRDVAVIRSTLTELRDAVAACTEVVRVNGFAEYHYDNLAGGPTPVVTPDGLGGYVVELELWPGRGDVTEVPITSGDDAVVLPLAAVYRLMAWETWGSSIADISEFWVGGDALNRFASAVTTEKSSGGTVDGIVNDVLTDTTNSQNLTTGCWWQLTYASAARLGYVKVARPNTTATRRLRTWATRVYSAGLSQWITALLRNSTDDMAVAATYAGFDLATTKVLVTPLMGSSVGRATAQGSISAGASLSVARPGYVEANDAVLLAWANVGFDGGTQVEVPIGAPAGVTSVYSTNGLYIGLRKTLAQASEQSTYAATNADPTTLRGMVAMANTLHNVDPVNPVGSTAVAVATKAAPSITVVPKQAIVVLALYGNDRGGDATLPSGFTQLANASRTGAAGAPRILAGIRAQQDVGNFAPGSFGGTDTPIRIVTFALNASRPE